MLVLGLTTLITHLLLQLLHGFPLVCPLDVHGHLLDGQQLPCSM